MGEMFVNLRWPLCDEISVLSSRSLFFSQPRLLKTSDTANQALVRRISWRPQKEQASIRSLRHFQKDTKRSWGNVAEPLAVASVSVSPLRALSSKTRLL